MTAFISSRRALGRAIQEDEYVLQRLRKFLALTGYSDLDASGFDRWRRGLRHTIHNTQVDWAMMVFRFCRYRRRREPHCFLPQRWTLGRHRPYPLPTPIEADQVRRLLLFAGHCPPPGDRPLRRAAHRLAIILMFTAGLRRGEVARLCLEDVDPGAGVLRINATKFHKSRWVPLSQSATREIRAYLRVRAALVPAAKHNHALLCSCPEHGYSLPGISDAVRRLMRYSGIWATAARLPRVHDFRHAFAVAALRRWYEDGRDVQSELPKLAMYMGHVSIASTTYYLRFMPAVVALASERFESVFGNLIEEGAI
ncbi:MAG: tyrosine-type recombinase/integrase [Steroidobacteraceae bacterium]